MLRVKKKVMSIFWTFIWMHVCLWHSCTANWKASSKNQMASSEEAEGFLRRTLVLYAHVSNMLRSFAYGSSGPTFVSSKLHLYWRCSAVILVVFTKTHHIFATAPMKWIEQ